MKTRFNILPLRILPLTMALAMTTLIAAAREPAPSVCQLRIATDPTGASVTIDGAPKDITPVVVADLIPGEHLVTIAKAGFRELRRTITLEPDQREALDLKLEPLCGLVLVTSVPDGAEVQINAASRGKTPIFLTDLPFGQHRLNLSCPGYQSKNIDIEIKDRKPIKASVELLSDSAALIIKTDPPGATVTLNGIAVGATPCVVDRVKEGDAALRIALDGYTPYEDTVKLAAGRKEEITLTLTPLPAELQVVSIPDKARVYINNQYSGESPLTVTNLVPGAYRVRAEMPGYEALARTVTLTNNGQRVVEEFRLEINAGTLELVVEPSGVRVSVDGKTVGLTVPRTADPNGASLPLTVSSLKPGTHSVELTRDGFFPNQLTIEIKNNEKTTRNCRLQQQPNFEVQTSDGIERGVLVNIDAGGNVKMEVRGIVRTIPAKDIISKRSLLPQ